MKFTVEDIARMVGGTVDGGDPKAFIHDFAKIEDGRKGAISFLANPKYTHHLYTTASTAVLVRADFVAEEPVTTAMIRVADPYTAIAMLLQQVDHQINRHPIGIEEPSHIGAGTAVEDNADLYVGAFAYVGQNVTLGQGVKIYPQAYVGDGVSIGEGTVIYAGAKIYRGCRIGRNCIIHAGAVIGADGFGFAPTGDGQYEKIPQLGIVEIDDNVEIGANTTIDRAMMGATRVGAGTKLDNLIQIAHNCQVGSDTVMAAQVGVAGSTKVGDRCRIGGQVGFAGHIAVGNDVVVGAQSGIPNDVKDGSQLMGYPAIAVGDFRRQAVYLKRLKDLFARIDQAEKDIESLKH